MNYQERIQKDAQEESKVQFTVAQSGLQAQADLLAVKQQLTALKAHLEVALSATTKFSLTKAAEIQYEISRLEEIYAVMVKLNTELFTV